MLKRYELNCPCCDEPTVCFRSDEPDKPFCNNEYCNQYDEEIDLDAVRGFLAAWSEYFKDREELLAKEAAEGKKV